MKAIDLYSGIGGWTLGLRLARIQLLGSYEYWQPAIGIYSRNFAAKIVKTDIRELTLNDLPSDVDLVVGSPPCTHFSFSNRGGGGDIDEGLKDLKKFLEIVGWLKPKFWALENVPRVKGIMEEELFSKSGVLRQFAYLFEEPGVDIRIFDLSEFGLPQRRKRCIAGKLPFELLESYTDLCPERSMRTVIENLAKKKPVDDLYGLTLATHELTDHVLESPLSEEEIRLNRDAKLYHPVYNNMSFPDDLDRPSRTITATCTRVSRESVAIADLTKENEFRRLTIRERASLQGFPITYQFFGKGYNHKIKVVGNAMPPLFAYYISQAIKGVSKGRLKHPWELRRKPLRPRKLALSSCVKRKTHTYSKERRFRAAIPNLRFKSGVRFELANCIHPDRGVCWEVKFLYGTPQDIKSLTLDQSVREAILAGDTYVSMQAEIDAAIEQLSQYIADRSPSELQSHWSHREKQGIGPFDLVDKIGEIATDLAQSVNGHVKIVSDEVTDLLKINSVDDQLLIKRKDTQHKKLVDNAASIFAGLAINSWLNVTVLNKSERA